MAAPRLPRGLGNCTRGLEQSEHRRLWRRIPACERFSYRFLVELTVPTQPLDARRTELASGAIISHC
jgi:hypothetical protein